MRVSGVLRGHSGYSEHARDMLLNLYNSGMRLNFDDIPNENLFWKNNFHQSYGNDGVHLQVGLPTTYIPWEKDCKRIAFTQWESTVLPKVWVRILNEADLVIPGSDFARDAMVASGVTTPVRTIRWPMRRVGKLKPEYFSELQTIPNVYSFLYVGASIHRKNLEDMIQCYAQEFQNECISSDGVIPQVDRPTVMIVHSDVRAIHKVAGILNGMSIIRRPMVILSVNPIDKIDNYYAGCNSLVLCSHGESVGGPVLHAQLNGLPVITTHWGGVKEYVRQGTGVDICGLEPAYDEYNVYENSEWARIDTESLMAAMRNEYTLNRRVDVGDAYTVDCKKLLEGK